jgi:hypothetical protein
LRRNDPTTRDQPAEPNDAERGPTLARRVAETASDVASHLADAGDRIAELGQPVAAGVTTAGAVAGRLLDAGLRLRSSERQATRARRLRRLERTALANLFELHPEVRVAARRDLGLLTIPVAEIRGTAVEGPSQRGADFLPLPGLRNANWRSRWQRVRAAQQNLAVLPPIDVLQTDDGYWVTDGHNRVAAALAGGQDDIDAAVTHVHLPGDDERKAVTGSLETILDDSRQVRAAGEGRLTRGATVGHGRARSPRDPGEAPPDKS